MSKSNMDIIVESLGKGLAPFEKLKYCMQAARTDELQKFKDFIQEVAEWKEVYSSTRLRIMAKELLKSIE